MKTFPIQGVRLDEENNQFIVFCNRVPITLKDTHKDVQCLGDHGTNLTQIVDTAIKDHFTATYKHWIGGNCSITIQPIKGTIGDSETLKELKSRLSQIFEDSKGIMKW